MNDINAAYDQIKNGGAQQYYGQQGSAQQAYGQYSDPFGFGFGGFGGYQQQQQQYERSEYTAARNYIRNGMYREALNARFKQLEEVWDAYSVYMNEGK